jgi:integrase
MKFSIVQRGKRYQLAGCSGGRRIRVSLGTANESYAADLKRDIVNALTRGNDSQFWPEIKRVLSPQSFRTLAEIAGYKEPTVPAIPTWKELRAAFTLQMNQRVAIGKLAHSTRQRYEYTLKSFEEFLGSRSVTDIRTIDRRLIEAYKGFRHARITEKKYSRNAGGLSLDVAILHGVFALAVENEMMIKNPVKMEGRPGDNPQGGAAPYTADALAKMRKVANEDLLIFLLLRWTGLRGSDAAALTWAEVNFENCEIERVTQKRKKKVVVPLHPELLFALEAEHQERRPELSNRVLLNPTTSSVMTRPRLYQRMLALGKRAGVANAHPHRFRDTLAVDMLAKGATPYEVAKTLGDTIATVEKHYTPFTKDLRERVRRILENGEGIEKNIGSFSSQSSRAKNNVN